MKTRNIIKKITSAALSLALCLSTLLMINLKVYAWTSEVVIDQPGCITRTVYSLSHDELEEQVQALENARGIARALYNWVGFNLVGSLATLPITFNIRAARRADHGAGVRMWVDNHYDGCGPSFSFESI